MLGNLGEEDYLKELISFMKEFLFCSGAYYFVVLDSYLLTLVMHFAYHLHCFVPCLCAFLSRSIV